MNEVIFADTHAHLYMDVFSSDFDDVIRRSYAQGVSRILVPGIDLETSRQAILLAEKYPSIYAAVGIHPNSDLTWDESVVDQLSTLAEHEKVVAIGEIGLDAYHHPETIPQQKIVLLSQLSIAARCGKPVIIHSRKTITMVIEILTGWVNSSHLGGTHLPIFPGVIHAFEGNNVQSRQLTDMGFFIGVGGQITYNNQSILREIVLKDKFDNIITETDCPFLSPNPYRGKRNEPGFISLVVDFIARVKGIDLSQASSALFKNASQLFHWS